MCEAIPQDPHTPNRGHREDAWESGGPRVRGRPPVRRMGQDEPSERGRLASRRLTSCCQRPSPPSRSDAPASRATDARQLVSDALTRLWARGSSSAFQTRARETRLERAQEAAREGGSIAGRRVRMLSVVSKIRSVGPHRVGRAIQILSTPLAAEQEVRRTARRTVNVYLLFRSAIAEVEGGVNRWIARTAVHCMA